jgi:hypothetical protein
MVCKLSRDPKDTHAVVEQYILMFLGVCADPIPSELHIQKELFIFRNYNKDASEHLGFVKRFDGPYSAEVSRALDSPVHLLGAWVRSDNGIVLSPEGGEAFKEFVSLFNGVEPFSMLLESIKLIRRMYDRLSRDELLLLVFLTYPDYVVESSYSADIYAKKENIASSLLSRGLITYGRYNEIIKDAHHL